MPGYTEDGIQYPLEIDLMKPLNERIQETAESTQAVINEVVGLRRVVPTEILDFGQGQAYLSDTGEIILIDVGGVALDGCFDWSLYRAFKVVFAFNQITADSSFSAKFRRQGDDFGSFGAYGWKRTIVRDVMSIDSDHVDNDGRPDSNVRNDRIPLTAEPGADTVHSAFGDLDIRRAGTASAAHGWVESGVNLDYDITDVRVKYGYNSTGRMFDGLRIYLTTGGSTFSGTISVYAYN